MINSKLTYLMSVEDIEAMETSYSARVYLDDHRFPNLRRGSRFTNRVTNLLKATSTIRRQGKSAEKNVLGVLNAITYYSATKHIPRMASMTIKPKLLNPIRYYNHVPFIADYPKLADLMKSIRHYLPALDIHTLASSIESTQQGMNAYVHSHSLLRLGTITDTKAIQDTLNSYLTDTGFKAVVQPFSNHEHSTRYAVSHFIRYMYKQYKLPVAYDKYGKPDNARQAFIRWSALSKQQRRTYIEAVVNSTRGLQLRYHVSYKRFMKKQVKQMTRDLAGIRFILHEIRAVDEPTLFSASYADEPQSEPDVSHHYTSTEQWQLAERYEIEANRRLVANGAKRLNEATFSDTYLINRGTKKATTKGSDDQIHIHIKIILTTTTTDRMRTSGIPP